MAQGREPACLAETLKWEGGWSNNLHDPGGPTMRGVIQREYDAYRRQKGLPIRSVRLIEDAELQDIYRTGYWNPVQAEDLPVGVDLVLFDYAVNSGPGRALMSAELAMGLPITGRMSTRLLVALQGADPSDTIRKIMDQRLAFLQRLNTWRYFGVGWARRCAGVRAAALAAAGELVKVAEAPKPQPDAQARSVARAYGDFVIPAADGPEGYKPEDAYAQAETDPNRPTKKEVVKTAASSKTVWSTVAASASGLALWVKDSVSNFFGNLGDAFGDVQGAVSTAQMVCQWLAINWADVAIVVLLLAAVVAIVRHSQFKATANKQLEGADQ